MARYWQSQGANLARAVGEGPLFSQRLRRRPIGGGGLLRQSVRHALNRRREVGPDRLPSSAVAESQGRAPWRARSSARGGSPPPSAKALSSFPVRFRSSLRETIAR